MSSSQASPVRYAAGLAGLDPLREQGVDPVLLLGRDRLALVSSASSGRPSDQVTSQAASSKALPVPWPNDTPACLSRSDAATTSSTSVMTTQLLERSSVDVFQHVEAGDPRPLVDLVDALVDRAELDDLVRRFDEMKRPSDVRPSSTARSSTPGVRADRVASAALRAPGVVGTARRRASRRARARRRAWRTIASTRAPQRRTASIGAEAEVEVDDELARDHVAGAGAGVDVRHLPRRSAGSAHCRGPIRRRRARRAAGAAEVDRISRQLRIGDVALHALDRSFPESVPRRPFLIVSPSRAHRRRLADDAVVEPGRCADSHSQTRAVPSTEGPSSSLVIRSAIAARRARIRRDKLLARDDHRRDRALHVGGAAAVEDAVAPGSARRGHSVHAASGPVGTTSVWPAKTSSLPPGSSRAGSPRGC